MWVDPQDSEPAHLRLATAGSTSPTTAARPAIHLDNIPLGEFYAVGVDMEDPYNLYGGLQDHDSWKGPSNGWAGEITLADWVTVGGGDGMYNRVDPTDSRWVYNNREMGTMWRFDQKTGVQTAITPGAAAGRADALRFNWTPPIALSPHNPAIVYTGAQVLFRSLDRGDHWQEISPDLTTNDEPEQHGEGFISFCTITTLAESPVDAGVIWAGADDGKVQVTKDGGATWTRPDAEARRGRRARRITGSAGSFASPHDAGTAFVAKTGFRKDDSSRSYLQDDGFRRDLDVRSRATCPRQARQRHRPGPEERRPAVRGNRPGRLRDDRRRQDWLPFKQNMPWVKVTDLVIHPRENDLVVATYGRGLYVADITPLQELTAESSPRTSICSTSSRGRSASMAAHRQLPASRRQPSLHAQRAERGRRSATT